MPASNVPSLRVAINANGSLRRFDCDAISLALFVGNELEGGPANLYLRRLGAAPAWTALLGPSSGTRFCLDPDGFALVGSGNWLGINYQLSLLLSGTVPAWFWHLRLENTTALAQDVDLTYAQDLALAPYGAVRLNEYYVSQYIDHMSLAHPRHGELIASRQNLAADGCHPWSLIGSLRSGVSFATDALQFQGLAGRAGQAPAGLSADLPGRRLQHEHSMVVIRDAPLRLEPGLGLSAGFFGAYVADHPEATSTADLERVAQILALPEAVAPPMVIAATAPAAASSAATLFSSSPLLEPLDLATQVLRAWFGEPWRHEERDEHGVLLSFFHGSDRHVVLRAKERQVLRPHGHLLRSGRHLTPDETALTSTAWMSGVFHSMLTQGHVSINRLLSTVHGYLGLFRSHGQRVFIELGGTWHLLDVPSAFEMSPDSCLWIYRHAHGLIEVRAGAQGDAHAMNLSVRVRTGAALRILITHHIALNGDDGSVPGPALWRRDGSAVVVAPAPGSELALKFPQGSFRIEPMPGTHFQSVGGDELLFLDGQSRQQPFLCVLCSPATQFGLGIRGELIGEAQPAPLQVAAGEPLIPRLSMAVASDADNEGPLARIADMLPWYTHDALVHYLSPRGLEQYSGGGWGTRDVCQGPVEMLLALGRTAPIRDLLLRVLSNQNADGDWPQWFMFFERERLIRAGDSHGDIVFWPLLVLGQYLIACGDGAVLDESVPFFEARGPQAGEHATVWEHVLRALALIERRVIPGTALAAYGHGDWNDALQPADPMLRERMCSAWTVTLHFQTLTTLARALHAVGRSEPALRMQACAQAVLRDFQRLLLVDGVLAGYAIFDADAQVRYLLHPGDEHTGVHYSALAIIHAILEDMLTPAQAREHLHLIDRHLTGPDGTRLFDRPMSYHGGPQRLFQRAESATFFGREIGLMYMHAHLRYAQALAHVGESQAFLRALCQASPIAIRALVPSASLRQANCYFSSSDAAFADRYEASAHYERVRDGSIALDGGWRVYSSGAGIALGLIIRRFLGLNPEAAQLRLDPVIPDALNGLCVHTKLAGRALTVRYRIGIAGCGVHALQINGVALPFTSEANAHRRGAALVDMATLQPHLTTNNDLIIDIG